MNYKDLPIIEDKDIEQYDRIDNFIMGRMTHEEKLLFLQDCKQDKELRSKAKAVALLVKFIMQKKEK